MLYIFYQSKDVTDTSLIVCTLQGKLRFKAMVLQNLYLETTCSFETFVSTLDFFFTFAIKKHVHYEKP